jgi:predicted MPP superfamily phosphohydrolase
MNLGRVLVFLTVAVAAVAALHAYLWFRLVRSPALPPVWSGIASGVLIALALYVPVGFLVQRQIPRHISSPLLWVLYVWMGTAFFLIVLLLVSEVLRLGILIPAVFDWRGAAGTLLRSRGLSRGIALGVALATVGLVAFSMFSALRPPPIRRVRVGLSRWPATLSPYTIVQVSDIHTGPTIGRAFVQDVVRRVNDLRPDLIAITGDLVDGSVNQLAGEVAPLRELRARDGVFFVTGNHEYYSGVEPWGAHIRSLGIPVLRAQRVSIRGAEGFDLAGVDDFSARYHDRSGHHELDVARALAGRDPARPVVLLAHQPRTASESVRQGVDLQISGHTHGGQIFPFHYLAALPQPFLSGLHRIGSTVLYISRGTGYWGPPMRFLASSEITVLELVRPPAGGR